MSDKPLPFQLQPGTLLKVTSFCFGIQYKPDPWKPDALGYSKDFSLEIGEFVVLCGSPFIWKYFDTTLTAFPMIHPIHGKFVLNFQDSSEVSVFLKFVSNNNDD